MVSQSPTLSVTDLEAAERQLRTALQLYFEDRDPVSVHTLLAAAAGIIDRHCKRRGIESGRDALKKIIKPERWKEVEAQLRKAQNFFKHGPDSRSGAGDRLDDFSDDANIWELLDAGRRMWLLGVEIPEAQLLSGWARMVDPTLQRDHDDWGLAMIEKISGFSDQPRSKQKLFVRPFLDLIAQGKWPPTPRT
jgi:hypothetical protein